MELSQEQIAHLLMGGQEETVDLDAMIERLREYAKAFNEPVRFNIGDLITPRHDAPLVNPGLPYLVIEVLRHSDPIFEGNLGDPRFGMRPQIRAVGIVNNTVAAFWHEAAYFEPFRFPIVEQGEEVRSPSQTDLDDDNAFTSRRTED